MGSLEGSVNVLNRVSSSNELKSGFLHCLWVYAYPVNSVGSENLQLFPGNGVRPAGFNSKFLNAPQVKGLFGFLQKQVKLLAAEGCGGASAEINRFQLQPGFRRSLSGIIHFDVESLQIPFNFCILYLIACEGTVKAPGGAEGYPNIQRKTASLRFAEKLSLIVQNLRCKQRLALLYQITFFKHFKGITAPVKNFTRKLHRSYPCKYSPSRFLAGTLCQISVQFSLDFITVCLFCVGIGEVGSLLRDFILIRHEKLLDQFLIPAGIVGILKSESIQKDCVLSRILCW